MLHPRWGWSQARCPHLPAPSVHLRSSGMVLKAPGKCLLSGNSFSETNPLASWAPRVQTLLFPQSNNQHFLVPPVTPPKPSLPLLRLQHQGYTTAWHCSACTAMPGSRALPCGSYRRKIKQDSSFQLILLLNWLEESIPSSTPLPHHYTIDEHKCQGLTMQFPHINKHLLISVGPNFREISSANTCASVWENTAMEKLKR